MSRFNPLFNRIDYQPNEPALLAQALTHSSYSRQHNERLEFLGDAVIELVISDKLYTVYPDRTEGELTVLRARLVKGDSLAAIADDIGLGDHIMLGQGELGQGGKQKTSILAGALEALIGAIYIDGGLAAAAAVCQHLFSDKLESLDSLVELKDAKSRLQEWLQSRKLPLPDYQLDQVDGQDHEQTFTVSCHVRVEGIDPAFGKASSRKAAEKEAARKMLVLLENER